MPIVASETDEMTKPENPDRKAGLRETQARREARIAAALRANLQRRKAQSRGRDAAEPESPAESAGKKAGE